MANGHSLPFESHVRLQHTCSATTKALVSMETAQQITTRTSTFMPFCVRACLLLLSTSRYACSQKSVTRHRSTHREMLPFAHYIQVMSRTISHSNHDMATNTFPAKLKFPQGMLESTSICANQESDWTM